MYEYYANSNFSRVDFSVQEETSFEEDLYYEKNGYRITCFINQKAPYLPAFKLYYGDNTYSGYSKKNTAKMCRISLLEPKYLGLEGENLILDHNQKIRLIEILNSPCPGCEEIRVWDQILGHYNFFHKDNIDFNGLNVQFEPISYDLQIPDYTKLPGGD